MDYLDKDLEELAAAAYDASNSSRDLFPEFDYANLPADQKEYWREVAVGVLEKWKEWLEQRRPAAAANLLGFRSGAN